MSRFHLAEPDEYQSLSFDGRPRIVWSGGADIPTQAEMHDLANHDSAIVILDAKSALHTDEAWLAAVRSIVISAVTMPKHFFFVFADPRLLSAALQDIASDPEITLAAKSARVESDPSYMGPVYRRIFRHVFVGARLNKHEITDPDHVLPWISTISWARTFLLIDGPMDRELSLENLKPHSSEVPYPGDFNLYDGQVFWAGTYSYRDSANAHMRTLSPLSLVIFEIGDECTVEDARHIESEADLAAGFSVPHMLKACEKHSRFAEGFSEFRHEPKEILDELLLFQQ